MNRTFKAISMISIAILFIIPNVNPINAKEILESPEAKKIPHKTIIHNEEIIDDYYWMRDRENNDIYDYLRAENEYTEKMMKSTERFRNKLYEEIIGRMKQTDLTVPYKFGNYYYYSRTEEGKQYRIYCRKKGCLDAMEEILFDQNRMAEGHKYFDIGIIKISPKHDLVAYSIDTTGSEIYTLYIKDLKTDILLKDRIENISSIEWANDNKTIFYIISNKSRRPYRLYRHKIGSDIENDELLHQEDDGKFWFWIAKTRNRKYLISGSASKTTSEERYLSADNPDENFKLFVKRKQGIEYYIDNHDDYFYIRTNENSKNYKLMKVPIKNPSKKNWKEIIPGRKDVKIEDFDLFENYLVVYEREDGLEKIRIINIKTRDEHYVDFPEPVYTFWLGNNKEFKTDILRFKYTSLVTPITIFDYDMNIRKKELKKQYEVKGGYNPEDYITERIFAKDPNGIRIPISIVYKKAIQKDVGSPLLLYGYGAYGSNMETYFSSPRLSLLDRGFVFALAHTRGGGELGEEWYHDGKLLKKKNTFNDFIICAECLISEGYTSKDKLIIEGGSAGGLLVGAVVNMRPDLFKAVIAEVPFVDILNTMMDSTIPLTIGEYEEWGNPNDKKYFDYIRSYSPYDNIEKKNYPIILIESSLNDTRVGYWEPTKWVAKLRALKTDNNILLLRTNMGAGHGGSSGRYDWYRDVAFRYSFMLDIMGIKE